MAKWPLTFERTLQTLAVVGAIASFTWGIWLWYDKSRQEIDQARLAAVKPFLEIQLKTYQEAVRAATAIANAGDKQQEGKAIVRFWELYWGEMALVENGEVKDAMVAFGSALDNAGGDRGKLKRPSLDLAHACRRSLDKSWGTQAWTDPDKATKASPGKE